MQSEVTQKFDSFLLYDERTLFLGFDCSLCLEDWFFDIFLIIANLTHCMLYHLSIVNKQNELYVTRWVFLIAPDSSIGGLYI